MRVCDHFTRAAKNQSRQLAKGKATCHLGPRTRNAIWAPEHGTRADSLSEVQDNPRILTEILGAKNPRTMNQNGTEIVVRILKDCSSVAEEKLQEERGL